ncbi:MAG: hypothetical protein Q7J16_01680 [Candidatus Cloacimonadales bacterium]|nr:hypothetical protein [Candidatus Cloacimonadales bacterium]
MLYQIFYCIILATLGVINHWLVKQNYHQSFTLGKSPFTSFLYDKHSHLLNFINIILWILILLLGIYWVVYWWLTFILFFISYLSGKKSALKREYEFLTNLELRGELKNLDGKPASADEEIVKLMEFRKKKLSGYYDV